MNAGPSIADLLEQTNRELAGTDARVYRRVADHLQRSGSALEALQDAQKGGTQAPQALLGKGSFQKLTVASLKRLCREHGIRGISKLKKAALARVLEDYGVTPPPPPLESFSKKELIALVRQLLAER
jgi:histone H3/H4